MTGPAAQGRTRRRRKPVTITRGEAVRRLGGMVRAIHRDVAIALAAEAALETANAIIVATPDIERPGAVTYETVAQSLVLNLAMSLARLYDTGSRLRHPNRRDLASIPLIARLLRQKRCQNELARQARHWTPQYPHFADSQEAACRKAIGEALSAFDRLRNDRTGRAAVRRLRQMRNKVLAHSYMDEIIVAMPTYDQVFLLADVARDVAAGAMLAIDGRHIDLAEFEQGRVEQAKLFWEHALRLTED